MVCGAPTAHAACDSLVLLGDPHIDPHYSVGAPTKCLFGDMGVRCCRYADLKLRGALQAGTYGSYDCDTPFALVTAALANMTWLRGLHTPCATIVLGDIVDHNDWRQTFHQNVNSIRWFLDTVAKRIGAPVIYAVGNHDTWFINQARPPAGREVSVPFYDAILPSLRPFLQTDRDIATFRFGGYYRHDVPGSAFRVVVLNAHWMSWYNLYAWFQHDPANQLAWLRHELEGAASDQKRILLVMHTPLGSSDIASSSRTAMFALLHEFRHVIVHVHAAHTHLDTVTVHGPSGVPMFTTPSFMPDRHDPGLRVLTLDTHRGTVTDMVQYILPLRQAGVAWRKRGIQSNTPLWRELYRWTTAYGIMGVSAEVVHDMVRRMQTNTTLRSRYLATIAGGSIFPCLPACGDVLIAATMVQV